MSGRVGSCAGLLGGVGGPAPEGIWDRIASSLEEAPPPLRLDVVRERRRLDRVWVLTGAAAAAVVAVAALGGVVLRQQNRIDDLQAELGGDPLEAAAAAALVAEGARIATLGDDVRAVIDADGRGYLLADGLSTLAEGRTWQLWALTTNGPISLGVLGPDPGAVAFVLATAADGLAITDEPAGGVPLPTSDPEIHGVLV